MFLVEDIFHLYSLSSREVITFSPRWLIVSPPARGREGFARLKSGAATACQERRLHQRRPSLDWAKSVHLLDFIWVMPGGEAEADFWLRLGRGFAHPLFWLFYHLLFVLWLVGDEHLPACTAPDCQHSVYQVLPKPSPQPPSHQPQILVTGSNEENLSVKIFSMFEPFANCQLSLPIAKECASLHPLCLLVIDKTCR